MKQTALVTGGSTGIGAEICRHLLAAGAEVFSLALEAPDWTHPNLHPVRADLMDPKACAEAAATIAASAALTHVVHCAGTIRAALLADAKLEDLHDLAQLHLGAALQIVQAALPAMRAAHFGRIILISSRAALGAQTRTAYANLQADGAHTPGPDPDAVRFLTEQRDVLGFGVETIGTDAGQAHSFTPPYPAHFYMHGKGRYGLQCLANLDQLPATGALIVSPPLKIKGGSGSPLRVLALVAG